jgi:hypothetical protein
MLREAGNLQYFFLIQYREEYTMRITVGCFGLWACMYNGWLIRLYCLLTGMLFFFVWVEFWLIG